MVSFVDRVKQAARIRQLRRRLSRAPTPGVYADLAELHIQKGQTNQAHRIALEGLELFPNARRLLAVSRFAKRQELQDRIRLLDETVSVRPHPNAFTELASIYWELGDGDRAEEVCTRCAELFPQNENPYLLAGEIRLDRFLEEGLERDGRMAMENLLRVSRLNRNNVKSHLLLARLFHACGAMTRCCDHLRTMLSITPTAREIRQFLTGLERRHAREEPGEPEDLGELLAEVHRTGRFANDPDEFPAVKGVRTVRRDGHLDLDELREGISWLARAPGIRRAVVLDGDGEVLLEAGQVARPTRSAFAALVRSVGETAFDLSRRMDVGTLQRADIEGPFGMLRLARFPGVLCCVLGDSAREAARAMDEFVARCFASRRVAEHA
jgi:tetratricopeptide (TPR) repeat protein